MYNDKYCRLLQANNLPSTLKLIKLEEKLIETIDDKFKTVVTFSSEIESFRNTFVTTMNLLVHAVVLTVTPSLQKMGKKQWGGLSIVGDQSEHITDIQKILSFVVRTTRNHLSNSRYFSSFFDRFVE
jgi:hypothetical protein